MMIVLLGLLSYIQKIIQTSLWQAAQMNYERAEKINKEVVQAIEAKDVFVSSLSHEIRNPLNALKGSIDYLFKVVKDPGVVQILENARLSGEVLLNLVNNVLDAAKLKSDKIDLAHIETTSLDMIKKLVMIHAERLREKKISAQVSIYKNVPTVLWIDSSRLLQIVMNLFSNAIKFTPDHGNIKLYISWCKETDKAAEDLLQPIDDQFGTLSSTSSSMIDCLSTTADQEQRSSGKSTMETERWYSSRGNKEDLALDQNTMVELNQVEKASHSKKMKTMKSLEMKRLQELAFKDVKVYKKHLVWNIDSKKDIDVQELNSAYSLLTQKKVQINKNGYLKVQISDNGCGIAEEHLPKMFEMFSQGGQNVGSVYGGSGLGLWLCKQICQKMGGDIELHTQPGKGTTFVFYVPVDNENLCAEPVYRTGSLREKTRGLVVDDFSYNRDIHKLLLEREGVQVNLACDGKEAVERYKAQGPKFYDFIMMDVQMPEMDGFTAAKEIRNWENLNGWRQVDIYFVSGEYYNEREILADLKAKGQLDETSGFRCLRKPIDVELVRKIVEKYFARRRVNLLSLLNDDDIKGGEGNSGLFANASLKNFPSNKSSFGNHRAAALL